MPDERPNVLFVITDQQRFDTIAALGHSHVTTPNLDRLVEEGVSFEQCHVTAPSCAPARASLFTGYYPHTTGIYRNGDEWTRSWVERLSEAGYYTVNVGKMHTCPYETPLGFDERYVVENKDRYLGAVPGDEPPLPSERYYWDEWDRALDARGLVKPQREFYRRWDDYEERLGAFEWPLPEDAHPDVFVGDLAVRWLDQQPKPDRPLFMEVGFPGPHPPYDPTEEWAEAYLDRDLPIQAVTDEDLEGQPEPFRAMREHHERVDHDSVAHRVDAPPEDRHRQRAYYLANVSMIDEQVGELMDALEANGYEDTVVVFTSDHGDALGDHGHSQKWTMYDAVTRVPAIVWSPGRFEGGRRVEGLCQLMDLGPTVLDIADAGVPDGMEARSLRPALEGADWDGRDYVFAEQSGDAILQEERFVTMVRDEGWKLVDFLDADGGQLFDLRADPGETENLWDAGGEAAERKADLLAALREWRVESGYETRDWAAAFR